MLVVTWHHWDPSKIAPVHVLTFLGQEWHHHKMLEVKKKWALVDKVMATNWYVMKVKSLTGILMMHIGVKGLKNKWQNPNPKNNNEKVYRVTEQDITEHLVVQTRVRETGAGPWKKWTSLTTLNMNHPKEETNYRWDRKEMGRSQGNCRAHRKTLYPWVLMNLKERDSNTAGRGYQ